LEKGTKPVSADTVASYLSSIVSKLRLGKSTEDDIAGELATHLYDSIRDQQIRGLSMEEAQKTAVERFGTPDELSRRLRWVHGFGRYSQRGWLDALLGSLLPFVVICLYVGIQQLTPALEPLSPLAVLVLVAIGISIYAFRAAVPAWTITWLGISHLLVLGLAYGASFLALRYLQLDFLPSHLVAIGSACIVLFITTRWMARHHVELTLLFLLPLTLPYIVIGYEDAPSAHGWVVLPIVGFFTIAFSFFYLLTRNQHPIFFALLGLVFYTGIYADIVRVSPAPFNATGLTRFGLAALLYLAPLSIISSPVYLYLRNLHLDSRPARSGTIIDETGIHPKP
jgi:hypothetical protein